MCMKINEKLQGFMWESFNVNNCNTFFIHGDTNILIDPGHKHLFDHVEKSLSGLGYALANQSNVTESDLEDFAQDALLRILDKLDTFRGESRFTTWAQKVAVRVAYSELRRRRWRDVSLQELIERQDEGYLPPPELADSSPSPELQATQTMMLSEVERFIADELTDRQRQALMAKMAGMPMEEIASRMDTNRNALYKLMHDARMRLRERGKRSTREDRNWHQSCGAVSQRQWG